MIIPIGHESQTVRRIPWITILIMVACIVVHIMIDINIRSTHEAAERSLNDVMEYYMDHPYLELDPEVEDYFSSVFDDGSSFNNIYGKNEHDTSNQMQEQEELTALTDKFKENLKETPYRKWGYIPNNRRILTQFTSMFVHGDWLHLIFNLLFLYLTAPFIEDLWGKPIFAFFYVTMGMMATLMHAVHYPLSGIPVIGASGAIAGVMGAFLVKYWNTGVKFAFYFSRIARGTFVAPAWVMLPMWVISEITKAVAFDSARPGGSGGGVAHWVHIWGFAFGFIFAMLMSMFKIAEKFVEPKIKEQTSYVNESYAAYEEAMAVLDSGDKEQAYLMLLEATKKDPYYSDVIESLWNLGLELGKKEEAGPYLQRLMDIQIKRGNMIPALAYFKQLSANNPDMNLPLSIRIVLLEQMVNQHDMEYAGEFSRPMFKEMNANTAPGLLINFCKSAGLIDRELLMSSAGDVINMALDRTDIPETTKAELRPLIRIPSAGAGMSATVPLGNELMVQFTQGSPQPSPVPRKSMLAPDNQLPPPVPMKSMLAPDPPEGGYGKQPDQFENFSGTMISIDDYASSTPLPGLADPPKNSQHTPPTTPTTPTTPIIPTPPTTPPPLPNESLKPDIKQARIISQQKVVKPTPAIPLGVKEGRIAVNIEKIGQKGLPLQKIKTMAVVKIAPPAKNPYLLIDLFLDNPATHNTIKPGSKVINIRSLRVTSLNFNPQKIIPNTKTPIDAFRVFTTGLLKLSRATTFPDQESVLLKKIVSFPSVKDYEEALLA